MENYIDKKPKYGDEGNCFKSHFSVTDMVLYQYFIEVVPTDVSTFLSRTYTYQYSVQDNERQIDHHKGSLPLGLCKELFENN